MSRAWFASNPALRRVRLWKALGWLLLAAIVYFSLTADPLLPDTELPVDKLEHFGAYLLLMLLFTQLYPHPGAQRLLGGAFIGLGVLLEFLQGLTGYRLFDYADMLANGLGVLTGWLLGRSWLAGLLPAIERRLPARGA
ncbi:MAG: VanZ family protein [Pseudomonadota bacterium]|uniref:VanZ family protein n=1 Tax=Thermithiobacillus tepidarius TaxID=929 RepID=UPI00041CAF92|nr:VanZ family protein [Thermithiobacillus tepidarius]